MSYPLVLDKRTQGWDYTQVDSFVGGLVTAKRDETIPDNALLIADNVCIREDSVRGDTGYTEFTPAPLGTPQTDYQFFHNDGSSELILITTLSVFTYIQNVDQWQYVSNGLSTTITSGEAAGTTNFPVTSNVGFSLGDRVGLALANGTQLQTTISALPSGHITLTVGVPIGTTASNGAILLKSVDLSGTLDEQISIDAVPSNSWIAFTNGVDYPMYYDGSVCKKIPNLPNSLTTCKALVVYNASLFLLNTVESGTAYPQRVRRSDVGNPSEWVANLAGFDDLLDGADVIQTAAIMGPYLIIYRERAIVRGSFVNTGGVIYNWETTVRGDGAVSTGAVVDLDAVHIVFSNAGIFEYTGGYDLVSVGDNIFYQIFSNEGNIDNSKRSRIFAFHVEELDEAWFFYPTLDQGYPVALLRYNIGDENWTRRFFHDTFVGFGFYQTLTSVRWEDLVGTWQAQNFQWNARTFSSGSPTTHLMGTDGSIGSYDYISSTDGSHPIVDVIVETKDFFNRGYSMRFDQLDTFMKGVNILVEYSTDQGNTYSTLDTVTSIAKAVISFNQQVICDKIRFRFTAIAAGFELDWLGFSYRNESTFRSV